MKRFATMLVALLMIIQLAPTSAFAYSESTDYVELNAHGIFFSCMTSYTFEYFIEYENNVPYIHFTSKAGTYGNNDYMLSFNSARAGFNMLDYPVVKIGYRTDSPTTTLDATINSAKGENWSTLKHSQVVDGEYHDVIVDINDLNAVKDKIPEYADGDDMNFRIKPLGAGSKTLTQAYYYDLLYIAFFKTENDALAHTYVYDPENDEYSDLVNELNYNPLTDEVEAEIYSGANALKAEILSTESISPDTITGTCYYVSNDGSDDNNGLTPETAFATIDAINSLTLAEGDGVFFRRGDVFRGQLLIQNGVTFSSYGEGEKPRLYHSIDASLPEDWKETIYKNVWEYTGYVASANDIGNIIFNGGEAWGIKISRQTDYTRLYQGLVYNGYESFVSSGDFLDERHLKNNLEFWHQWESGTVFMYCDYGNPGVVFDSIEMSKKGNVIRGQPTNVVIDNLSIMYTGSHGIGVSNAKNFTVQNCYFAYIGGSLQYTDGRVTLFGNAVENWASCDGFTIDHCYATQVYDCCYTTQWQGTGSQTDIIMKDVVFSNTVSEYSNSGPEVWLSANDGDDTHTYLIENLDVYGNYVLNNGYGWSHQRPNKDGNFFYGGSAGVTTVFNNAEYHDNVFFKASSIAIKARYSKVGYGYNFRDNVFVMAEGQSMVETGNNLNDCTGTLVRYKFNLKDLRLLTYFGFFPNCTYYYYDIENADVPMPDVEPPRDPDFEFETAPIIPVSEYVLLEAKDLLKFAPDSNFQNMTYNNELMSDENGVEYFRINSKEGTYGDSTCVFDLPLSALGYQLALEEYPFVRIGYKTNIVSGSEPKFNYYTQYKSSTKRLWGPTMNRISDELHHYDIISVKELTNGGLGITDFSWDNIDEGALYETLHLKLWGSQTIEVSADEYYDISYIGFFKSIRDAAYFEYSNKEILYGDVNDDGKVNIADEILFARYNANIKDFLLLENMRAADVNCDGYVRLVDYVILARHVAGWSKYASLPYTG